VSTIILQRKKVLDQLLQIIKAKEALPKKSVLLDTIADLSQTIFQVCLTFIDFEEGSQKRKSITIPEFVFFIKSRLDPTWSFLLCLSIRNAWKKFLSAREFNGESWIYFKMQGGTWDNPATIKNSIDEFKKTRARPSWRKGIVGGQFGIEICKTHFNFHVILLVNRNYRRELIERYLWQTLLQQFQDKIQGKYPVLATENNALKNFERAILLCGSKDLLGWDPLLVEKILLQCKGLAPMYKFGALTNEKKLDYSVEQEFAKLLWKKGINEVSI
jgi:hypothetical protein